ncbi:hypothetical protein ELS19_13240 [Halogeometricum borinquense]|uniref:GATA-type domain-containing protein n=1 Tax=Halogeometricum borinquense TaxID=60847 RepID=A0A482TLK4_9EURY|nr:hypothetical protein [Halogeometricum borinquense]RYJ14823.1 hypothetical protein ELS19_13240 [Halogeometricum borinquense]
MTTDRSLDEFVGGDSSAESETDTAQSAETNDEADENAPDSSVQTDTLEDGDSGTVSPAVGTYRWDPDGVECPTCGEIVERLWLDEDTDAQVCADCKAW